MGFIDKQQLSDKARILIFDVRGRARARKSEVRSWGTLELLSALLM